MFTEGAHLTCINPVSVERGNLQSNNVATQLWFQLAKAMNYTIATANFATQNLVRPLWQSDEFYGGSYNQFDQKRDLAIDVNQISARTTYAPFISMMARSRTSAINHRCGSNRYK